MRLTAGEWLIVLEELEAGDKMRKRIATAIDGRKGGEPIELKVKTAEEDRICYALAEGNTREFLGAREYARRARPALKPSRTFGRKELGVKPQPRFSMRSIRLEMKRAQA